MQEDYQWLVGHMEDRGLIDDIDGQILQYLINNSQEPIRAIADATGVSRPTIYERKRRLENAGIIDYYTTQLNYNRCGLPVTAFILAGYDSNAGVEGGQKTVARKLSQLSYVKRVHIITGDNSFIVEVAIDHMRSLADLIIEEMRKIDGVGNTDTKISFGSYQNGHEINLPRDPVV